MNICCIQEDKSPRSKRKRDATDSSNDDTDDERPRKRGRPPMRNKETFKGFSDVEVREGNYCFVLMCRKYFMIEY